MCPDTGKEEVVPLYDYLWQARRHHILAGSTIRCHKCGVTHDELHSALVIPPYDTDAFVSLCDECYYELMSCCPNTNGGG